MQEKIMISLLREYNI